MAFIVIPASITSSIRYINLKEGKAINTKITAGVIVQTISNHVPWTRYLCEIILLDLLYEYKISANIQETVNVIKVKYIIT